MRTVGVIGSFGRAAALSLDLLMPRINNAPINVKSQGGKAGHKRGI